MLFHFSRDQWKIVRKCTESSLAHPGQVIQGSRVSSHGSIWKRARFMDADHARSIDVHPGPYIRSTWSCSQSKEVFQVWINYPGPIDHGIQIARPDPTAKCLYFAAVNVDGLLLALGRRDRRPSVNEPLDILEEELRDREKNLLFFFVPLYDATQSRKCHLNPSSDSS